MADARTLHFKTLQKVTVYRYETMASTSDELRTYESFQTEVKVGFRCSVHPHHYGLASRIGREFLEWEATKSPPRGN
jgi:hypothetical protein